MYKEKSKDKKIRKCGALPREILFKGVNLRGESKKENKRRRGGDRNVAPCVGISQFCLGDSRLKEEQSRCVAGCQMCCSFKKRGEKKKTWRSALADLYFFWQVRVSKRNSSSALQLRVLKSKCVAVFKKKNQRMWRPVLKDLCLF